MSHDGWPGLCRILNLGVPRSRRGEGEAFVCVSLARAREILRFEQDELRGFA
jgi:hypothetical protein